MVVSLCPDLREWYVVFITEGAACATLQVSSVLCRTVGLRLGAQSILVPPRHLVHVLLLHVSKAVGCARTRGLYLGLGTSFSCDSHLSSYTTAQAIV